MSLYDMFFSKQNKNHIFNIIREVIIKETGTDINSDQTYIDLYRFKYTLVFERSHSDNLIDLNKSVIDEIAPLFINDIRSKYKDKNIEIVQKQEEKQGEKQEEKQNSIQFKKQFLINSGERIKNSMNRYEYYIQLPNHIKTISLKEISLPSEDNILFSSPILCIRFQIKKEEYDNYCLFDKTVNVNNNDYVIYKPSITLEIPSDEIIKITILTNLLTKINDKTDRINIYKFKKINLNQKKYLGIKIKEKHDLQEKNLIGIYSDDKIIKTMMITEKIGNNLLIENETNDYEKTKKYYILDLNLQNNIILDYS